MSVKRTYYIARNPDVSGADINLAHAAPYDRLVTALHDMGGGVIFDETGEIDAFHERHAELLERRGSYTMTNANERGGRVFDFTNSVPGVAPVPVNSAAEARDLAIEWQAWASEADMSYGEMAEWLSLFEYLAGAYGLAIEFRENGIIA